MASNEDRTDRGQGLQHNWLVIVLLLLVGLLLFSFCAKEIPQGAGSGFIWDDTGYIVTNYHVMENAKRAKVILADGSVRTGLLVGTEPDSDVAVLKIEAPKSLLPPITIGTSENLEVGQKVYAIGSPFGFDQTLTTGIISGREGEFCRWFRTRQHSCRVVPPTCLTMLIRTSGVVARASRPCVARPSWPCSDGARCTMAPKRKGRMPSPRAHGQMSLPMPPILCPKCYRRMDQIELGRILPCNDGDDWV